MNELGPDDLSQLLAAVHREVAALAGADCKHQVDLPRSLQPWRTEKKAAVRQGLGPHGAAVRGNVDRRLDHRRVVGKTIEEDDHRIAAHNAEGGGLEVTIRLPETHAASAAAASRA